MQVKTMMDSIFSDNQEADLEAYEMTLDSFKSLVADNSSDLAKYVKELQAVAELQKQEAKALADMAKATAAKADKVMAGIAECLNAMEIEEVQAGPYKFKFKKGSTVTEVDEKLLPDAYFVEETFVTRKPLSKPELKKLVDGGISIAGVKVIKNPPKLELK